MKHNRKNGTDVKGENTKVVFNSGCHYFIIICSQGFACCNKKRR